MTTHRTLSRTLICVTAALLFFGVDHASAARIYNFTNQSIDVQQDRKSGGVKLTLKPGQRSDSLEWASSLPVLVWHPFSLPNGQPTCTFDLNTKEIVGGNYLLVVQKGDTGSCTICDAGRKVRFKREFKVKPEGAYTTPDHQLFGCE